MVKINIFWISKASVVRAAIDLSWIQMEKRWNSVWLMLLASST